MGLEPVVPFVLETCSLLVLVLTDSLELGIHIFVRLQVTEI